MINNKINRKYKVFNGQINFLKESFYKKKNYTKYSTEIGHAFGSYQSLLVQFRCLQQERTNVATEIKNDFLNTEIETTAFSIQPKGLELVLRKAATTFDKM